MNKLIINQAAARTITMGASGNTMYSIIFHIMYNIIINLKDNKNKLN
jgi:hypothetical protein